MNSQEQHHTCEESGAVGGSHGCENEGEEQDEGRARRGEEVVVAEEWREIGEMGEDAEGISQAEPRRPFAGERNAVWVG